MQTNNKLREVLGEIILLTYKVGTSLKAAVACGIIAAKAKSAFRIPPRNCDVGTAKEQLSRFEVFCKSKWDCKKDCPIGRMINCDNAVAGICQLTWAQMPYEAKENEVKE